MNIVDKQVTEIHKRSGKNVQNQYGKNRKIRLIDFRGDKTLNQKN